LNSSASLTITSLLAPVIACHHWMSVAAMAELVAKNAAMPAAEIKQRIEPP
jgi:hypothetical protein